MSSERTEQATPKRRDDARKRGQVARSPDLSAAVALLGTIVFLQWYAGYAFELVAVMMRDTFGTLDRPDFTTLVIQQLSWELGVIFARVTAPILAVGLALGLVTTVAQTGIMFTGTGLKPDFRRINPLQGAKRIVSKRGAFDTVKAFMKLGIIGALAYPMLMSNMTGFASLTGADPMTIGRAIGGALGQIGFRTGVAFLIIAVLDYAYQRWAFEQELKMSKKDVRDEMKQMEGSPELKSRIRRIQREMASNRMMSDVPAATVVLTNPTHLAIAIKFDLQSMSAPVVVAKGSGHIAERIKDIARHHGITIMENKPLARTLYKMTEPGMEIPVELYEAVADVIAYIFRLRTTR